MPWVHLAGIVATLAVILMSLLRRDDADYVGYGDEGDQVGWVGLLAEAALMLGRERGLLQGGGTVTRGGGGL
jgi:uncharacterized membrane protein